MHLAAGLFALVSKLGGVGLLLLGVLDSSFLFAPWGNDVLVVAMTAKNPTVAAMVYYAVMSTAGSVLGCLLLDYTFRRLGASGLDKYLPAGKLRRVKGKVQDNAVKALAVASLAPPPFPFTAFVMAAAALQYCRVRLLVVVGATRMIRFIVVGILALHFGERILKWSKNPTVQGFLVALIIVCTIGSAVSIYQWIRHARSSSDPDGRSKEHSISGPAQ